MNEVGIHSYHTVQVYEIPYVTGMKQEKKKEISKYYTCLPT